MPGQEPKGSDPTIARDEVTIARQPMDAAARKVAEDAVPVEWKVGDVILDTYEVKGVIGEGGMGNVTFTVTLVRGAILKRYENHTFIRWYGATHR